MRVLFANAAAKFREVENRYRPLWPGYLAAYAQRELGSRDFQFRFATKDFRSELESYRPHLVGLSSVTQNFKMAEEFAGIAKERQIPVLVGGSHITALPESLTEEMDVACLGEGESTFVDLLKVFSAKGNLPPEDLSHVQGIAYRNDGTITTTTPRPMFDTLDRIPHPDRKLIGYGKRSYVFTARGCPHACIFCQNSRFWKGVRYASPEYVIEEIRELVNNGVRTIRIADDDFLADRGRAHRIVDLVVANGYNRRIKFSCWCRSNNVTRENVEALKAMNVVAVVLGLESASPKILRYLKGSTVSVDDNARAVDLLKDAGIQTSGDFVLGAPHETEEDMQETYDFIRKSRLDFVTINFLCPLPGTPLWNIAIRKGLVSKEMDWNQLSIKFNGDPGAAIILSKAMSYEKLKRINRKFKILGAWKAAKALPRSPWLKELPAVGYRRLLEMLCSCWG